MNNVKALFQEAVLAEAAYANFINPVTGGLVVNDDDIKTALMGTKRTKRGQRRILF